MTPLDLLLMLAIPSLTLADLVQPWRGWVWAAAVATLLFVARQRAQISRHIGRTSVLLLLVGALLLPLLPAAAALGAVERGLRIGVLIGALLVAINLLSRALGRSPRVRLLLERLHGVASQRRYGVLSVASQFFGGLLGLAGIAMMMETAARQDGVEVRDRLSSFSAITRGYASVSLWSPMYSNMSIVLAMYAGQTWVGVLPVVLGITVLFAVLGLALDRAHSTLPKRAAPAPVVRIRALLREGWPVLLGMLCFLGFMVVASRGLGLPISAVIIATTPVAAWVLNRWILGAGVDAPGAHAARQMASDLSHFRGMSGEVLMFMASGCAGTVIGSAIPPAWTAAVGAAVAGAPALACLTVSASIVLLSMASLHPMLSAVIVGASLGPAVLGLPALPHLSAVLVGWSLAIIVTPFSVVSTLASRWSGLPVLAISLRANALFVMLALGSSAGLLGLLARLTLP